MNSTGFKLTFAAVVAAVTITAAQAKTCVWTGAKGGSYLYWSHAENWENNEAPKAGDTVVVTPTSSSIIIYTTTDIYENFYLTNAVNATISNNNGCWIRVSGKDSKIVNVQSDIYYFYSPIEVVNEDSKVEIVMKNGDFKMVDDTFSGKGTIDFTGSGKNFLMYLSSPDFHGTMNFYANVSHQTYSSTILKYPFGAADAVVNLYAGFTTWGRVEIDSKVNFCKGSSMCLNPQYSNKALPALVTFNNDVTCANAMGCSLYGGSARTDGLVFNKSFNASNKGYLAFSNYGSCSCYLEINGQCYMTDNSGNMIETPVAANNKSYGIFRVSGKYTSGHSCLYNLISRRRLLTETPYCLPERDIWCGYSWDNKASAIDAYLDMQGNDQKIGRILYYADTANRTNEAAICSTGKPATLRTGISSDKTYRKMPSLGGMATLKFTTAYGGVVTFPKPSTSTGWLATEGAVSFNLIDGSFANLGGIEIIGGTYALISNTTLNANMTLDVHNLTNTDNGRICVATDEDLAVKHVYYNNVDLPAGKYCRTGAGVEGATEVEWMGTRTAEPALEGNGTVTIAAHNPVWIYTGAGSTTDMLAPGNWGANVVPDLTDEDLTLNFKNAAGEGKASVGLSGTVAPKCAINCGDYSRGVVTFGSTGTLELGCAADTTNEYKFAFADSANLTWNGPGTLILREGQSTSSGTLTVKAGKVILDYAAWAGQVVVEEGAELIVNKSSVESGLVSAEVWLEGKLTPAADIQIGAVYVDGERLLARYTYGSTESGATKKNDTNFGGAGKVVSLLKYGTLMLMR